MLSLTLRAKGGVMKLFKMLISQVISSSGVTLGVSLGHILRNLEVGFMGQADQ